MPRKGRKYQNDEKVLDRLKIPINIIKCKKKPESDQTGREAAARGGISDETPSSGQSPKKSENLQNKPENRSYFCYVS